jgi:hypothetical protein
VTFLGVLMLAIIAYLWGHSRGESQESAFWQRIVQDKERTIDALRRAIAEQDEDDESRWWLRGEESPY